MTYFENGMTQEGINDLQEKSIESMNCEDLEREIDGVVGLLVALDADLGEIDRAHNLERTESSLLRLETILNEEKELIERKRALMLAKAKLLMVQRNFDLQIPD